MMHTHTLIHTNNITLHIVVAETMMMVTRKISVQKRERERDESFVAAAKVLLVEKKWLLLLLYRNKRIAVSV